MTFPCSINWMTNKYKFKKAKTTSSVAQFFWEFHNKMILTKQLKQQQPDISEQQTFHGCNKHRFYLRTVALNAIVYNISPQAKYHIFCRYF